MTREEHDQGEVGTPSEQLVAEIIRSLKTADLIRPQDSERLTAQLSAGTLKPEDWIALAENAVLVDAGDEP